MVPKKKPAATAAKKLISLKSMGLENYDFPDMHPPAATKLPTISKFSVNPTNTFIVAYYTDGMNNYIDVAIRIHSTIDKGELIDISLI
jgi:hypothetical protein